VTWGNRILLFGALLAGFGEILLLSDEWKVFSHKPKHARPQPL
jgi:hypothetical protein